MTSYVNIPENRKRIMCGVFIDYYDKLRRHKHHYYKDHRLVILGRVRNYKFYNRGAPVLLVV